VVNRVLLLRRGAVIGFIDINVVKIVVTLWCRGLGRVSTWELRIAELGITVVV
jgi:hypothetical protein